AGAGGGDAEEILRQSQLGDQLGAELRELQGCARASVRRTAEDADAGGEEIAAARLLLTKREARELRAEEGEGLAGKVQAALHQAEALEQRGDFGLERV